MLNSKKFIRLKSRESIFYIADQAFYNLFSFVLIVILVRTLPSVSFGYFSSAYYLFPLLSIIQHALIQMPLMNLSGKYDAELPRFLLANLVLSFCLGLGVSALFALILLILNVPTINIILFSLFYFLFQCYEIIRRILIVQEKKIKLLFADIFRFILPITLFYSLGESKHILSILIFGFIFLNLIFMPYEIFKYSQRGISSFWKKNWQFGRWICANNIIQNISSNLFLYLGIVLLTTHELVSINAPRVVMGLGSILFLSMENIYTPKLHRTKKSFGRLSRMVVWIFKDYAVFFVMFYSVLGIVFTLQGTISQILFKIPSEDSTMWAYIAVLGLSGIYRPILLVLRFSGLDKNLLRASLISFIIVLVGTYPMMYSFGLKGALFMMMILPLYNLIAGVLIIKKYDGKALTNSL